MQSEPRAISDAELIHAIRGGDEQALATIYDRYSTILFSLVLRILNRREEAEDVLQEVFLQIWRHASDYDRSRGRVFTWLVTIARSRALDRARSRGFRESSRQSQETAAAQQPYEAAALVFMSEQCELVRDALRELPDDQRRALYLAYFEGLTQTEIANHLHQPLGSVKTRMRAGIGKLREILRESKSRN